MSVRYHGECGRCHRTNYLDKIGGKCARCGLLEWAENHIRAEQEWWRKMQREARRDARIFIGFVLVLVGSAMVAAAFLLGAK